MEEQNWKIGKRKERDESIESVSHFYRKITMDFLDYKGKGARYLLLVEEWK